MRIRQFLLFFQLVPIIILSQVEKDSTDFGLDSLLNKNVKRTEYVNSASKYSQAVYESPNALDVITQNTIQNYGYDRLSEVLSNSDAIYINNDLNYQFIGISGFGRPTDNNNRVQLLFDGHKLNDYVYNAMPIDELALDVNSIDKIEFIKGPGSVLYGANAMFGVINIIPQKGGKNFIPKIRASYGSYNSKSISSIIGYDNKNNLSISLHGYYNISDGRDYYFSDFDSDETNKGVVNNLDGEIKRGVYASIKYNGLELFGIASYRCKEVPTAPYGVDFGSLVETKDIYNFLEGRYSTNIGFDKQFTFRIFYDRYFYSGLYTYNSTPTWDNNDSRSVGIEAQFLWDPVPFNRIIFGAEVNRAYKAKYEYWDDTQVFSSFDIPVNIYSMFVQDEYHLSNELAFYLAARLDFYKNSETKLSPRATVIYSPNEINTLRLLIGTSFRNPAVYERYYEDELGGYKKNELLSPEQILSYELDWSLRFSQVFNFDLSIYRNQIYSFIEQVVDPVDSLQYYTNSNGIKSYGIGLGLKADSDEDFGGYITFQYQHTRDGNNNKTIISPESIVKFGIFYKVTDYLKVGFEHRYESTKLTVYGTSSPAINYSSLNIFNPVKFFGFNVSITIKNLFNKTIQNPGGLHLRQLTLPMPGRNYMVSIGYEL